MAPDSDKPWSKERAQDIKDSFQPVIRKARETGMPIFCLYPAIFSQAAVSKGFKRG